MKRTARRVVIAAALIGLGWAAGKAQTAQPDFELVVDAPAGTTNVECRRGCGLLWVERGTHDASQAQQTFTFSCSGPNRCSSARVGGWVKR
jgi:hypothetical protein